MKVESIALLFADGYADVESGEDESDTSIDETQGMTDSGADEDEDDDAVNQVDVEFPNEQEKNNIALMAIRANNFLTVLLRISSRLRRRLLTRSPLISVSSMHCSSVNSTSMAAGNCHQTPIH